MKKVLSVLMALAIMLIPLAACSGDDQASGPNNSPANTDAPDNTPGGASENAPSVDGWDFSQDKTFNLTFSLYLPDGNSAYDWITPLCEGIAEATEGTVTIEVFPGGTLATGDETADAIKNGVADIGLWPTAYGLGTFPISYMMEYPGIEYGSAKAASYAFTELLETLQPAEIQDFKLLFSYCSGPGVFLTSNSQIKTVSDFSGLQIRTNACNAPAVQAYGGTATTLAVSEVYESMRTGVIDGYCGLTESLLSFKLQEVTKYCVMNPNF